MYGRVARPLLDFSERGLGTRLAPEWLAFIRFYKAGMLLHVSLEPLLNCQCCFKFWGCSYTLEILFLCLCNIKKVQKQDLKNIKDAKGCRKFSHVHFVRYSLARSDDGTASLFQMGRGRPTVSHGRSFVLC